MCAIESRANGCLVASLFQGKYRAFTVFVTDPDTTIAINAQVVVPVEKRVVFLNRYVPVKPWQL